MVISPMILAAAIGFWWDPALAHAELASASPEPDAALAEVPTEVATTFSEPVEPAFTTIAVTDAAGAPVHRGAARVEQGATLAIDLGPLAPGVYTVGWKVTSVDTHGSEGAYRFSVAP
jgi:methionine-rich copper-binding protein CopC